MEEQARYVNQQIVSGMKIVQIEIKSGGLSILNPVNMQSIWS